MTSSSTDPLIGRILDDRYEVLSRIARGGMATVYVGTDLRLDRQVAIKVMHGHLADDEEYTERFIQEARSAARLSHTNVVSVFDQGQDADTAYLVMEYVPGITLRALLNQDGALSIPQTLQILEAVLSGLSAAHASGLVHRDVKPENILLADDGRIKISDFGLARAAHANTATGNALLGTIAYLSPELIIRGVADTRSDIYATGIMLYEMLTGVQPFVGEQAFQVAHQHATDQVPPPSNVDSSIPAELDELVLWATARDPEHRPRDARPLLEQVQDTAAELRELSPARAQATRVYPASPGPDSATRVFGATAAVPARVDTPAREPQSTPAIDRLGKRSRRRTVRGLWLFLLVLFLAGGAAGTGWYFGTGPGAYVSVPSVTGLMEADARAVLSEAHFTPADESIQRHHPTIAPGEVMGSDPAEGSQLPQDSVIALIVSAGPEQLPIPELVGLSQDDAAEAITAARFTLGDLTQRFDADAAAGVVLEVYGAGDAGPVPLTAGDLYSEARPVSLLISLGPVPNVAGLSLRDATATLAAAQLTAVEGGHEYSNTVPRGDVIRMQWNTSEPVTPGATITLVISDGVELFAVPDVGGKTWEEAKQALTGAGFAVDYNRLADISPGSFTVSRTKPEAGEMVEKGTTVKVTTTFTG